MSGDGHKLYISATRQRLAGGLGAQRKQRDSNDYSEARLCTACLCPLASNVAGARAGGLAQIDLETTPRAAIGRRPPVLPRGTSCRACSAFHRASRSSADCYYVTRRWFTLRGGCNLPATQFVYISVFHTFHVGCRVHGCNVLLYTTCDSCPSGLFSRVRLRVRHGPS